MTNKRGGQKALWFSGQNKQYRRRKMMTKLIEELNEWAEKYHLAVESEIEDMDVFYDDFKTILSRYSPQESRICAAKIFGWIARQRRIKMRVCKQCGRSIEHKHPNAKFCKSRCKDKYHNTHNPRGYGIRPERSIEDSVHPQDPEALGQWDD